MVGSYDWVLLAYRLPREPSAPRLAVWRRLRTLGAAQLVDGLVALPADASTREQLEWVAERVVESGGEAWVWIGRAGSARQERGLAASMAAEIAEAYAAVRDEAHDLRSREGSIDQRTVGRLRRELRRIAHRDYFPTPERDEARAAVEGLMAVDEAVR